MKKVAKIGLTWKRKPRKLIKIRNILKMSTHREKAVPPVVPLAVANDPAPLPSGRRVRVPPRSIKG